MRVLGIDPAREIARRATESGIETLPEFFTNEVARRIRREHGAAGIVTANNVFAHADDLADVAEGVRTLLASDGFFVFEVSYLLDIIENMVFDFIYHEHLSYHSVKPLRSFLRRHGMELIDIQRVPVKGGSLRCIAQPIDGCRMPSPAVAELVSLESRLGLDRHEIFGSFRANIEGIKSQLLGVLTDLQAQGKTFGGYGASATTTVLLHHFNLGNLLNFLVDDNPSRQGLFSPGHHIPVLGAQVIYERRPGYIIVLAWRYFEPIRRNHQRYLEEGGHFIVPLPRVFIT
jgi:hypothetical protein